LEPAVSLIMGMLLIAQVPTLVQVAGMMLVVAAGAGAARSDHTPRPPERRGGDRPRRPPPRLRPVVRRRNPEPAWAGAGARAAPPPAPAVLLVHRLLADPQHHGDLRPGGALGAGPPHMQRQQPLDLLAQRDGGYQRVDRRLVVDRFGQLGDPVLLHAP